MKTWIVIALSLVACSKKSDKEAGGGAAATKEAPAAKGPPGVAAWMPKEAESLWQGAWFTRMSPLVSSKKEGTTMAGDAVAVEVKGKKATVSDGTAEVTMDFQLQAPCMVNFAESITEGSMKGGTANHGMIFVVQNGALVVGSNAAGYRKGKSAIVCAEGMEGGITLVGEDGKCATWKDRFGEWEKKDTTCTWSQADGKDVLTVGTGDWAPKLQADGDVLTSEQFRDFVKYTKKAKDYAEAKTLLQAELDAKDPSKQAVKAGGEVGKTDTIVNLTATWGTDKSLKGKPFEITALWLNSNTMTSNGKTTYNGILTDKVGSEFTLACDLGETKPPELKQGDKVKAKGTLDAAFGRPELDQCTVEKAK